MTTALYLLVLALIAVALLLMTRPTDAQTERPSWDEIPVRCVDCRGV